MRYFQDLIAGNHCYGCGSLNHNGLAIKSSWASETEAVCLFTPQPHHCAAPTKFLNGGIIATIIDCHSICTAIAHAYKLQGREIGEGEAIWYATGNMNIDYKRPVPISEQITLRARVVGASEKTLELACTLEAGAKECASATVLAALVPSAWMR